MPIAEKIYEQVNEILQIFIESNSESTEKFIDMVMYNPDIWALSTNEIQLNIIQSANSLVQIKNLKFHPANIIDFLLNSYEIYINVEHENQVITSKLATVITNLMKNNLNESTLSKFISYANLYYIRRLPNYHKQLYSILLILLNVFLACKEKFTEEIKAVIKTKRDSKILSTLFVVIDFYLLEKTNNENKQENNLEDDKSKDSYSEIRSERNEDIQWGKPKTIEEEQNADASQAIALYILATFDWGVLAGFTKEMQKEEQLLSRSDLGNATRELNPSMNSIRNKQDIIGYLIRTLGNRMGKETCIVSFLLKKYRQLYFAAIF